MDLIQRGASAVLGSRGQGGELASVVIVVLGGAGSCMTGTTRRR
ncbi:MAG TPA: hypothetical protein VJN19_00845 [Propionibacteriaceae bacterium]|nr:hypothetical protein [Propionibacteriaceae bacterium]